MVEPYWYDLSFGVEKAVFGSRKRREALCWPGIWAPPGRTRRMNGADRCHRPLASAVCKFVWMTLVTWRPEVCFQKQDSGCPAVSISVGRIGRFSAVSCRLARGVCAAECRKEFAVSYLGREHRREQGRGDWIRRLQSPRSVGRDPVPDSGRLDLGHVARTAAGVRIACLAHSI
jgi:hypothetical protein